MTPKELKSNYLLINEETSLIDIYETMPESSDHEIIVKNATINIGADNNIEIIGDLIQWDFVPYKTSINELEDKPSKEYIKKGFSFNLFGFTFSLCDDYVNGWYQIEETKPYKAIMNKWYICL